jgi:hypothetical protein
MLIGFVFMTPASALADLCAQIWGGGRPPEKVCSLEWVDPEGRHHGLEYRIRPKSCTLDSSPQATMQDCGIVRECDPVRKREGREGTGRIRFPVRLAAICPEGLGDFTLYDFDAKATLQCTGKSAGKIRMEAPSGSRPVPGSALSRECDSGLR